MKSNAEKKSKAEIGLEESLFGRDVIGAATNGDDEGIDVRLITTQAAML